MQTKNSFDNDTLKKIGKGFLINLVGAIAVFATSYQETGNLKKSGIIAGTTFLSSVYNAIREYTKGDIQNTSESDLKRDN